MNKIFLLVLLFWGQILFGQAPTVTNVSAYSTSPTSATISFVLNPGSMATTILIQYGTNSGCSSSYFYPTAISNQGYYSITINGLNPGTLYYYRIQALGSDVTATTTTTFTTIAYATTIAATSISGTSATLNGSILANNLSITGTFHYGLNSNCGTTISTSPSTITGTSTTAVSAVVEGLTPNTMYYYQVQGVSSGGIFNGNVLTFTTSLEGSGTIASPYLIYNYNDLKTVKNNLTAVYRLMADINASASQSENQSAGFMPIGNSSTGFTGTFHGGGHTISNLYISRSSTDYVGLFGYISGNASIDSVTLTGGSIVGQTNVGSLVGSASTSALGKISNCTINTTYVSGTTDVGGLVGSKDGGLIINCISTCSVSGTDYVGGLLGSASGSITNCSTTGGVSAKSNTGGLIGYIMSGTISNCFATGSVRGTSNLLGGLLGLSGATITNCYAKGNVTASGSYSGGLIGYNGQTGSVKNSFASGTVTGYNNVGGLIGLSYDGSVVSLSFATGDVTATASETFVEVGGLIGYSHGIGVTNCYALGNVAGTGTATYMNAGGLIGDNYYCSISNCYAIGKVKGSSGLIGSNYSGTASNSFWNIETSSQKTSSGGIGKADAELVSQNTYTSSGWDFVNETVNGTNDYWNSNALKNNGYPYLAYQTIVLPTHSTQTITNISANTAMVVDTIIDLGGSELTAWGACWNSTGNPTISDNKENGMYSSTGELYTYLSSLIPNTTYYVKPFAANAIGMSYGKEVSFTTNAKAPNVTSNVVTNIAVSSATINGSVNANNSLTSVTFEYGITESYGTIVSASISSINGISSTLVSASISNLLPNTTYHYRVIGTNSGGITKGLDMLLTTYCIPTLISFTPNSCLAGSTVIITGTNFIGVNSVRFGGTNALTYTVTSSTTIEAVIGSGTSGDVSVTTAGGTASINGFVYINDLIINSGEYIIRSNTIVANLIIRPEAKLSIQSGIDLTILGNLTLQSDITGTATLVDNGTLIVSGTTTVEQYISIGRNWYIASPVSTAKSSVIKSEVNSKLWQYNETTSVWEELTNTSTSLGIMSGYVANKATNGIVSFTGENLNTGTISISNLSSTLASGSKRGFNLIGNPYPSCVSWDMADISGVDSSIWYRTQTVGNSYVFDTYNSHSKVGTNNNGKGEVTGIIPPMQAVWVHVKENQTGSVTFNNAMRSHPATGNVLKADATAPELIRLQVANGANTDEAIVVFNPEASNAYDAWDSQKMFAESAEVPQIYTTANAEKVVINGLESVATNSIIPLGFKTAKAGTFTISATEINGVDAVVLEDKLLNKTQDLTGSASYTFTSDNVDNASRFAIRLKANSVTDAPTVLKSIITIAAQNKSIVVTTSETTGTVNVYDLLGRIVETKAIAGTKTIVESPNGVYFVKVQTAKNVETKKLIIE